MMSGRRALAAGAGAFLALGFGASLVGACAPSPASPTVAIAVTVESCPPVGDGMTDAGLSLPVGTVAQIGVFPMDDAGDVDDASVFVRADDSTNVVVAPMTTPNTYVLIGVTPGDTTLRFFLNGQETTALTVAGNPANALPVEVVPQPPRP
jgi:hypothetical protein